MLKLSKEAFVAKWQEGEAAKREQEAAEHVCADKLYCRYRSERISERQRREARDIKRGKRRPSR